MTDILDLEGWNVIAKHVDADTNDVENPDFEDLEDADLGEGDEEDCSSKNGGDSLSPEAKPRKSMRAAINAYCKDCCYDPMDKGNWRQQTGACTVTKCALWEFRPGSKPRKARPE